MVVNINILEKKSLLLLLLLYILFFHISCSERREKKDDIVNIYFKVDDLENKSIVLYGDTIIGKGELINNEILEPGPGLIINENMFLLTDNSNIDAFLFNKTDNSIKNLVSFGKGVNELTDILNVCFSHDNIVVIGNGYGSKILFFNQEGNLIKSEIMQNPYYDATIYKDSFYGIPIGVHDWKLSIYNGYIDYELLLEINKFNQKYEIPDEYSNYARSCFFAVSENEIFITNQFINYISVYSKDGEFLRAIHIFDDFFDEMDFSVNPEGSDFINSDIFVDETGLIFLGKEAGYRPNGIDDRKYRIDVFKINGELKAVLLIDNYPSSIYCKSGKMLIADREINFTYKLYDYSFLINQE